MPQEYFVSVTVPAVTGPRLEIFSARVKAMNEQSAVKKAWTLYRGGSKTRTPPPPIERPGPQLDRRRRERRDAWNAIHARVET